MSEYVVEIEYDTFNGTFSQKRHEEIVRCRECKHFTPKGAITFLDYSTNEAFCSYIRSYKLQIGPDGFCAWGERK